FSYSRFPDTKEVKGVCAVFILFWSIFAEFVFLFYFGTIADYFYPTSEVDDEINKKSVICGYGGSQLINLDGLTWIQRKTLLEQERKQFASDIPFSEIEIGSEFYSYEIENVMAGNGYAQPIIYTIENMENRRSEERRVGKECRC